MKHEIFVSYRRTDRELVASIVRRLEARGVNVWYDASVSGGSSWSDVSAALNDSAIMVVFFSEDANSSRQLVKELELADEQGKPVVPVLIEDTRPKGALLHAFSDRNWISAFPDPMGHIDELVDHLATLAGKPPVAQRITVPPAPANDGGSTPEAANDHTLTRASEAYVGRVGDKDGRKPKTNDILPFNLIDLLVMLLLAGGAYWAAASQDVFQRGVGVATFQPAVLALMAPLAFTAYACLILPVRYFMRRRPTFAALRSYLISTGILLILTVGGFLYAENQGLFAHLDAQQLLVGGLAGWAVFTVVAFLIYGVLSAQRGLRSFRSNVRKI